MTLIFCVIVLMSIESAESQENLSGQNKSSQNQSHHTDSDKNEYLAYSLHRDKKVYLKEVLENFENDYEEINSDENKMETSMSEHYERDVCRIKKMEISIKIENCGRITLNTTKCDGFCKSFGMIVPNTKLQKNFCYACKSLEFEFVSYKIKCLNGNLKILKLKKVKACTCFKYSEKMSSISNVAEKNFLNF